MRTALCGPVPPFVPGCRRASTSPASAQPGQVGQVGSGAYGLNTLFHEGGHAAHFANIRQNALLLAGVPADFNGLCRNPVDVLRQPAGRRRLVETLCENAAGEAVPDALIDRHRGAPADARSTNAISCWCRTSSGRCISGMTSAHAGSHHRAGARGRAKIRHQRQPAPDAGDPASVVAGVRLLLPWLSAGDDGGGTNPPVLPAARRLPDGQPGHWPGSGATLLVAGQQRQP